MKALLLLLMMNTTVIAAFSQQTLPTSAPRPAQPDWREIARRNRLQIPRLRPGPVAAPVHISASTFTHPDQLAAFIHPATPARSTPSARSTLSTLSTRSSQTRSTPSTSSTRSSQTPSAQSTRPTPSIPSAPSTQPIPSAQSTPSTQPPSPASRLKTQLTLGAACTNHAFFQLIGLTSSAVYIGAMTHTQDDGAVITGAIYDTSAANRGSQLNAYVMKCDANGNILWTTLLTDANNDPLYYFNPILIKEMAGGDLMLASYFSTTPDAAIDQPATSIFHLTATGTILWHTELKSHLLQSQNEATYFSVKDINPGQNGDVILSGTAIAVNYGDQGAVIVRLNASGNYVWDTELTNTAGNYTLGAEGMSAFVSGNSIVVLALSHGTSVGLGDIPGTIFATLDYNTGNLQSHRYWVNDYSNDFVSFYKSPAAYYNYAVQKTNGNYLVYALLLSTVGQGSDTVDYFGIQEYDPTGNLVNAYTLSSLMHTSYESNIIYIDRNSNGYAALSTPVNAATSDTWFSSFRNDRLIRQRVHTTAGGIETGNATKTCFMDDGAYLLADEYYDPAAGSSLALKKLYDTDTSSVCLGRDTSFLFKVPLLMKEDPGYHDFDPPLSGQITTLANGYAVSPITHNTSYPCSVNSSCSLLTIQGPASSCGATQPLTYIATRNPGCGGIPLWTIDTSGISDLTQVNDTTLSILFRSTNWSGRLTATIPTGACSMGAADSVLLSIIGTPRAPDLVPDTTNCTDNAVILHAGPAYSTYLWQDGSTDSNYTATSSGNYTVSVTDVCGNSYTSSSLVKILQPPPVIRLGNDTSLCSGVSLLLDAGTGFAAYLWNTGQTSEQITAGQAGAYSIAATAANGCISRDTLRINAVYPLPQFSLGAADTSICGNTPLIYTFPANGDQYLWSDGSTSPSRSIDAPGTYGLQVVSPTGCTTGHSITVGVQPMPILSLGADTTLCNGNSLLLNASSDLTGVAYRWQDGSTAPSYNVTNSGVYSVTASLNGCSSADSITVSYIGIPEFSLGADTALCEGASFTLHPAISYAGSLTWQDGSSQDYFLVQDTGLYTLSATNSCGSSKSAVYVSPGLCRLIMPNAFTPNGDGRNDLFRIKYPFVVSRFRFVIYNRWGQQVFMTTNIADGWDGTVHGAPAPPGAYVWYISLTDSHQKAVTDKGTVLLIR